MANTLYNYARESFLTKTLDWTAAGTIKAMLIDNALYTFSASHKFLSDVSGSAIVKTSGVFTSTTGTDGAAAADNVTFTAVSGASIEAIIIFEDTGTAGTSRLIAYIDTATGLPITPNTGDIIVVWDTGANKIFKL